MTAAVERTAPRPLTVALLVLAAVATSAVLTTIIALVARAAGAGDAYPPLQSAVYLSFAVAGTLAALGGWALVVRFVRRSARLLRILVPVLVVLSLVPDVALLALGFIPGTTPGGVVALMLMHLAVAGVAVMAGQRIAPAR
ncbi:MAG: DUF6069 family protein [Protaetiibacter sp.]